MKRRITAIATLAVLLLCGVVWARMSVVVVGQGASAAPAPNTFSVHTSQTAIDIKAETNTFTMGPVSANDIVVIALRWSGTSRTITWSDGTSNLTNLGVVYDANGNNLQLSYISASVASGNPLTYTVSGLDSYSGGRVAAYVITPSSTACAIDAYPTGGGSTGTGTSASSGNIVTTGTAEIVFGAIYGRDYGQNGMTIGGGAVTGSVSNASDGTALYYRTYTSAPGTITSNATFGASTPWICNGASFK